MLKMRRGCIYERIGRFGTKDDDDRFGYWPQLGKGKWIRAPISGKEGRKKAVQQSFPGLHQTLSINIQTHGTRPCTGKDG